MTRKIEQKHFANSKFGFEDGVCCFLDFFLKWHKSFDLNGLGGFILVIAKEPLWKQKIFLNSNNLEAANKTLRFALFKFLKFALGLSGNYVIQNKGWPIFFEIAHVKCQWNRVH